MSDSGPCVIALTVAYDGTGFAGFARQPGQRTVQGELERALAIALRGSVDTVVAGRTDAGVHAFGQVVSFPWDGPGIDRLALRRSLNALAGEGIVVREVLTAREGFSARFDATGREYRYRIVTGDVPPQFIKRVVWWLPDVLDVDRMRCAAAYLVGEHDFRSFCASGSAQGKVTMRRIDSIDVCDEEHLGERCMVVTVVGNAFLHSMVRVIVGTLVQVGSGRRDPAWVADVLSAQDRRAAGPTAPAQGLMLWKVRYPEDVWR